MTRISRAFRRPFCAAAVLLASVASPSAAQPEIAQPETAPAAAALEFRRVFVPARRLDELRRPGTEYRAIDREDFERLVELAGRQTAPLGSLPAVRIEGVRYSARLSDDDVLSGELEVGVALDVEGPALLGLAPLKLAIADAAWKRDRAAPALLGLAADGRPAVLVEESDTLVCRWSLRGRREEGGEVLFDFAGVAAGASALELALPANYAVEADDGPLVELREANDQERHWRIDLGGRGRIRLRLRDVAATAADGRLVLVRQTSTCDVSRLGIELAVRFDLDVQRRPLDRLDVAVDPGLRIVAARLGEERISWSASAAEAGQPLRVTLRLPRRIVGAGHAIHLNALGPVQFGEAWWLPTVRPLDVFWREGESLLRLPPELTLERLAATGARQSQVQPLPAQAGEAIALQNFSPQARVQLVLVDRPERLEAACASAVRLAAAGASGTFVADLKVAHGERFALEARIAPSWTIDSVVSDPADALSDWSLVGDDYPHRRLHIELARALTPQRPLRLEVRGRRLQSSLGEALSADDLRMLVVEGVSVDECLVAVEAGGTFQLDFRGADRLNRLDPRNLRPAQAGRLLDPPTGAVFAVDAAAAALRVTLRESSPRLVAEIEMTAAAGSATLTETYVIRCTPQGTPLERLRVRFSHARGSPLLWTLADGTSQPLPAELVSTAPGAGGAAGGDETWEVVLPQPQTAPFTLAATRTIPLAGPTPLSLAGLPEALAQQGTVHVEAAGDAAVRVENERLKAIPPPVAAEQRPRTTLGFYRYEPAQDSLYAAAAAVAVAPLDPSEDRGASLIWECSVQSRVAPDQRVEHAIVMRVEHAGSASLGVQLAPQCVDLRVWVDNAPAPWYATPRRVSVELPAGRRFSTVTLRCGAAARVGHLAGSVAWPLRTLEPPCLATSWTLWLPPDYDLFSHDRGWHRADVPQVPWTERLFGPLARSPHTPAFDPLAADDWRGLAESAEGHRGAWRVAERVLGILGQDAAGEESGGLWADRLAKAAAEVRRGPAPTFWIDAPALADAGLRPDSPLPAVAGSTPEERGAALLERGQLVLLIGRETVLLTSTEVAALHRAEIRGGAAGTYRLLPGEWSAALDRTLDRGGGPRYVAAERWRVVATGEPAWGDLAAAGFDPADTAGWNAYRLTSEQPNAGQISFVRGDLLPALGWVAFACVLVLGWRSPAASGPVRARRCAGAVGACALFSLVALSVPPAFAPVTSGAVWGALVCLLNGLRGAPPSRIDLPERRSAGSLRRSVPVAGLLFVVAAALLAGAAPGQEDPEAAPPPRSVYEVLIPVAAPEEPPAPRYYLVPERLYRQLDERAALATGRPREWLIDRAAYRASLAWEIVQQRLVASELHAAFNLHVFEGPVRVRIPLSGMGPEARPAAAALDGAEIPLAWEDDGQTMAFDVAEPGSYRFAVSLKLGAALDDGGLASLRLTTPAVPRATLEVPPLADAPAVEVPSALGAIVGGNGDERLTAQLGPSSQLVVAWPVIAARPGQQAVLDVEQLLWLKVRPGAVSLAARLKLSSRRGDIRTLRVAADRNLQLLPPEGVQVRPVPMGALPAGERQSDLQLIDLDFAAPLANEATLDLTLLLADSSGLGNLRLPRFSVVGARTTERLLAVSLDEAALDCRESGAAELEALSLPDFAARWEGAAEMPKFVYRLPEGEIGWGLACSPRQPRATADAALLVSVGAGRAEVRFDVQAQFGGARFQHRLALPAELRVDAVTIAEGAERRDVRWARDAAGALTVFLTESATSAEALRIAGWLPLPESGDVAVPQIRLEETDSQTTRVGVYRQPDVLLELLLADALGPAAAPPATLPEVALGRLVREFQAPAEAPWGVLRVAPNRPDVQLVSAVGLARDGRGNWSATLECLVDVHDGVVDELRFDVSPEWAGPYEVVPPGTAELLTVPAEERRQLLVRPREAIASATRVAIRGPLSPHSGGGIRAPWVQPLSAAGDRYVLLPRRAGGAPLEWETQGLRGAELPPGFPPPAEADVWQVVADASAAVLRRSESSSAAPRVRLVDCRMARRPNGGVSGVAGFDLDPAGMVRCPLWLPRGTTLIQVTVEGRRVVPEADGADRWQLDLSSARLPQHVVVAFTGGRDQASSRDAVDRLAAPRLGEIPIERTQWTVFEGRDEDPAQPIDAQAVDRWRLELGRLEGIVADFSAAAETAGEESSSDVARWARRALVRWQSSLAAAEAQVALLADPDAARIAAAELREVGARLDAHRQRLSLPSPPSAPRWMADPLARWEAVARGHDAALYATADDGTLQLLLRRVDSSRADRLARLQAAAIVLVAALVLLFALRRPSAWAVIDRATPAWTVAVGLFWWLWLAPSVLGWAIVLTGCGAALRRVRRSRPPESASSIIELRVAPR